MYHLSTYRKCGWGSRGVNDSRTRKPAYVCVRVRVDVAMVLRWRIYIHQYPNASTLRNCLRVSLPRSERILEKMTTSGWSLVLLLCGAICTTAVSAEGIT